MKCFLSTTHYIKMITEVSCDTEDWITGDYILKYSTFK